MTSVTPPTGSAASEDADNQALASPGARYAARLSTNVSAANLRDRIIDAELRNLTHGFDLLSSDDSLVHAAGTIVSARRRYIIGAGKSFALATLMSWELSSGLGQVLLIDDVNVRSLDVLSDVRDTDVLVVFSFRRYRRHTLTVAEEFAAGGGAVIGITDRADSPIAAIARETVVVPTASASYTDSPTGVAAVVHLLSTLATASSKGARRRLSTREKIAHRLETYAE